MPKFREEACETGSMSEIFTSLYLEQHFPALYNLTVPTSTEIKVRNFWTLNKHDPPHKFIRVNSGATRIRSTIKVLRSIQYDSLTK